MDHPAVRVAAVSGVTGISVAALWTTGPWALPLALLGIWFIRPRRSGEGREGA